MSDSDSGSDDGEVRQDHGSNEIGPSSSEDSDSTPSHRSQSPHDESSRNVPSDKDTNKSGSERSPSSPPRKKLDFGSDRGRPAKSPTSPTTLRKGSGSDKSDSEHSAAAPENNVKYGSENSDSDIELPSGSRRKGHTTDRSGSVRSSASPKSKKEEVSGKSDSEMSSASGVKKKELGSDKSDSERSSASPRKNKVVGSDKSDSERSSASVKKKKGVGSEKSDSERSSASPRKLKKSLIADSSEEEDNAKTKKSQTAAIFGEDMSSSDSDDERGDAVKKKRVASDSEGNKSDASRKSDDSIHGIRMYPEQEEETEKELPPTIIETTISKVDCDFGEGIQFMKIPNFFSVAQKPFDPETYEEDEDDDHVDDEGRNRLKLKAENTIRWRFAQDADGNLIKESNTRIVRWSDGTMSMVIGKEVFDVESVPILGNMQHLFVRQGAGLVAQKVFDRKLIFRPHSTDSETHRKVTMNMAERTRKSGQVRMVAEVGSNPEQARREAVRREEEALRAAIRKETQQRRTRDRHRPTASFLDGRPDYSDEDADLAPRRRGVEAPLIGASDSEESDVGRRHPDNRESEDSDEEFRKKKQQQKKKIVTSDEESD